MTPVCVVCDGRIGCEFCPGGYVPPGEDFCPPIPDWEDREVPTPASLDAWHDGPVLLTYPEGVGS